MYDATPAPSHLLTSWDHDGATWWFRTTVTHEPHPAASSLGDAPRFIRRMVCDVFPADPTAGSRRSPLFTVVHGATDAGLPSWPPLSACMASLMDDLHRRIQTKQWQRYGVYALRSTPHSRLSCDHAPATAGPLPPAAPAA